MKGIVVYYSAGGNTLKLAKAIYRGMKEVIDCDVASVKEVDPKDMGKYDLFGIGSPLWLQRETHNVRQFIYNMPDMTGKLGFVFCTHGMLRAHIFWSMIPPIQRKGLTIIGWHECYGGVYIVGTHPKPSVYDGHPDAIDLKEGEAFGREIAGRAQRIYAGEKNLIPEIPHGPEADPLFQNPGKRTHHPEAVIPHRTINMEKCLYPECTQCVDNCRAHALDFSVDPPTYNRDTCINCLLCDRMCPVGAIEIPNEERRLMQHLYRINMEKCKYPECTICVDYCPMDAIDFSVSPPVINWRCEGGLCKAICPEGAIEQINTELKRPGDVPGRQRGRLGDFYDAAEKAEAQGLFRRIVPRELVGLDGFMQDWGIHPWFNIEDLWGDEPLPPYFGNPFRCAYCGTPFEKPTGNCASCGQPITPPAGSKKE